MIVRLQDVTIGYDDEGSGSGPPAVFLHGFPHDRTLWDAQRRALSPQVRCVVPDLRGFGQSSTHGPFSMDHYADDVVALLDHLGIEKAAICGLSMGGYVAMAMWRRHADRIAALVFSDTRAGADSVEGQRRREELMALARTGGATAIAENQLPGLIGSTTRAQRPEISKLLLAMMTRQSVAGIVGALAAMRDRPDSFETLSTVSVPTLVVVGEEDALTPIKEARSIAEALPKSARVRMEIIAAAGHVPCVERPAAATHALADFFATLNT